MQQQQDPSVIEENINPGVQHAIFEISRWSRLISVVGFAMGAFVVVVMLFSGATIFRQIEQSFNLPVQGLYGALIIAFFIIFFIAAAVLYFLYKAAALLKQGVLQNNTTLIAEGFIFLKKFFVVTAIISGLGLLANLITLLN